MASAWKKPRSSRWFIGFMAFAGSDGTRQRLIVSVPEERASTKEEAVRLGDHLAACVKYLEGTDLQLEKIAGSAARTLAINSLLELGVITHEQAASYSRTGRVVELLKQEEPAARAHQRPGTIANALAQYMADCRSRKARRTTDTYEAVLERFIEHVGGSTDAAEAFSREKLNAFETHREGQVKKSKRVKSGARALNLDRQTISAFASWMVEHDLLGENRVRRIWKHRREAPAPREILQPDQIGRILQASDAQTKRQGERCLNNWRCVISLLLETGLRVDELLHLQWEDVILQGQPDAPKIRVDLKPHWKPKDYERRELPISQTLAAALGEWRKKLPLTHARPGAHLVSYGGKASHARRPLKSIKNVVGTIHEDAKVPFTGFHIYRHTFAVRAVERGLDAFALQQMLGHASLKTSEIYLRWADQRKAMERARKALSDGSIG